MLKFPYRKQAESEPASTKANPLTASNKYEVVYIPIKEAYFMKLYIVTVGLDFPHDCGIDSIWSTRQQAESRKKLLKQDSYYVDITIANGLDEPSIDNKDW